MVDFCVTRAISIVRLAGGMSKLTVAFNHEWFNNIMSNHLEVGMSDPVAHIRTGTGEEVVEDSDLMTKNHKSIYQVRADEASAARYKNSLSLRRWEEPYGGKAAEGRVGNGVRVRVVNRLALVLSVAVVKPCMVLVDFHYLLLLRAIRCRGGNRSVYIVRPEVESAQRHERYFRVETKALEADSGDLITVLIESGSLREEVVQICGRSCRSSHHKRNQAVTAGGLRKKGERKTRRRWQMPAVINTFLRPKALGL